MIDLRISRCRCVEGEGVKGLRAQDNTRYEFRHRRQGRRYRRTQGGMWEEPRSLTVVHLATSLHASTYLPSGRPVLLPL